jgi:hypothetical protein
MIRSALPAARKPHIRAGKTSDPATPKRITASPPQNSRKSQLPGSCANFATSLPRQDGHGEQRAGNASCCLIPRPPGLLLVQRLGHPHRPGSGRCGWPGRCGHCDLRGCRVRPGRAAASLRSWRSGIPDRHERNPPSTGNGTRFMPLRPYGSAAGVPPSADQQQRRAGSKSSRTEIASKIGNAGITGQNVRRLPGL